VEQAVPSSDIGKNMFYIPAGLMAAGIFVETSPSGSFFSKYELQKRFSEGDKENVWDDYAQFLPLGAAVILPAFTEDGKSRDSLQATVRKSVLSEAIMLFTVTGIKSVSDKKRPNGSKKSFPSGHTAQSFLGAQILYMEYRDTNRWLAYAGYPVAAFVAAERVDNSFHWTSDVLVGAAIGMAVPTFVYWLSDKKASDGRSFWGRHGLSIAPEYSSNEKGVVLSFAF